jgi:membrane-anchored mycosin MYCP
VRNGAAVTALIALSTAAPSAHAVPPPVIDNSLLPAAAAPTPPRPGVQREPCAAPAVSSSGEQPHRVGLASAHALSRGEGQRVAVIDTGVTRHHRLADVEAAGDYVSTGDGTEDCDGHGTLVAGIIAATPDLDDATGFTGIAPAATILAIRQSSTRFAPDASSPAGSGDVATMAMAVRTAADLGATVINISTVACATGPLDDGALGAALAYAVDVKDVVVVAAAGNVGGAGRCPRPAEGSETAWETATVMTSPGWYDDYVLTVGSVGATGAPSDFSLPGPWVDVAARGEQVISLHPGGSGVVDALPAFGRAMPISGTSYAAPVVSGVAALVRSRFPELTARQVMHRIESTARTLGGVWTPLSGNGIVDPVAALSTEATTETATSEPAPRPISGPARTEPAPDTRASTIAISGAGICAVLVVAAAVARSRRGRGDDVMGGQRR